jgi:iron complex outermembrane receptor protein
LQRRYRRRETLLQKGDSRKLSDFGQIKVVAIWPPFRLGRDGMRITNDWEKSEMNVGLIRFGGEASRHALIGAALAFTMAGAAVAQDQPESSAAAPEEIVVTGSRIKSNDVTSANPLTVVTAAQIQQTEAITAEQFLRKIPEIDFSGGISSNDNNGGVGASEVGLHNLGPQRTLVLINGLRFPYTDTGGSYAAVDLNNIPVSMIDHVEILRDGASSIYGADAIAGVINIITKQNYNGFEVGGSVGSTTYNDGTNYSSYATLGQTFDRGSILINLSYNHRDAIPASDRSWAVDQRPNEPINGYDNISSRITGANVSFPGFGKYYFGHGIGSAIADGDAYTLGNPLDAVAYGGGKLTPGDVAIPGAGVYFNYLPTEYLTGSLDEKQANFTGHYDITDGITAVFDGFYTNRDSQEELNPEPLGANVFTPKFPQGLLLPAYYQQTVGGPLLANPYFPKALYRSLEGANPSTTTQLAMYTRRFEDGPRVYTEDVNTYRFHFGFEGTVYDDYNWEVGYYYGRSESTDRVANEVNFDHLEKLVGLIPCGADAAQGCSIANFLGYNTLTKAQAAYLVFDNTDTNGYGESTAFGNISGPVPLIPELPGGPIKASIGFEYRTENGFDSPDSIVAQGDSTVSASPTSGGYTVGSGYIEVKAPVLKDLPFVKSFDVDASSRYDYYSTFGRALTYKAGIDYAVSDDFRLRGANSTGFRAPQIKELYGGQFQTAPGGDDPCATGGAYAFTPACLKVNGGNPGNLTQINQLSAIAGGNSSLKPETSQSWSIGGVFTPTVVPNFSFAVDYYTILVRNEISSYDANGLLASCYGGVQYVISQAASCALITRQGKNGTGNLGFVYTLNGNIADENTSGIDFETSYGFDAEAVGIPGGGHFTVNGSGTYLLADDLAGLGAGFSPCSGSKGCSQYAGTFSNTDAGAGGGEPRWKATLTLGYSQDDWSFQWTTRYYGGVHASPDNAGNNCAYQQYGLSATCPTVGAGDYPGNEAAGIFYHDIAIGYNHDNITVIVGVDNLFDKDPPYLTANGDVYIGDAGYDAVGRMCYLKTTVKFGGGEPSAPPAAPYVPPAPTPVAPAPVAHSYMVFFDFNKSDLTPDAVKIVAQAAANAGPAKVTKIDVTGHTDTVGSDAYNMRLSRRRAESVAAELEKDGVPASEIAIFAKGKHDLLIPTGDGVKEPQNRRVQIVYDAGAMS